MSRINVEDKSCWVVSLGNVLRAEISCHDTIRIVAAHRNYPTENDPCVYLNGLEVKELGRELIKLAQRAEEAK